MVPRSLRGRTVVIFMTWTLSAVIERTHCKRLPRSFNRWFPSSIVPVRNNTSPLVCRGRFWLRCDGTLCGGTLGGETLGRRHFGRRDFGVSILVPYYGPS